MHSTASSTVSRTRGGLTPSASHPAMEASMSFVAWFVVTISSLYTRFPPYACPDSTFIIQ